MFLEFVATIAIGFGAAGVVLMANWLTGGRLPRWLIPVGAAAGMVGFMIWSEQTWASRVTATLPPEVAVASKNETRAWFRPWTYMWPMTNRITLVDHRFTRRNDAFPDMVLTAVVLMGRWEPGRQVPVMFDCRAMRRADMREDVVFTEEGAVEGADWLQLSAEDPLLRAACNRG